MPRCAISGCRSSRISSSRATSPSPRATRPSNACSKRASCRGRSSPTNDYMAVGVMEALSDAGVRVPDQAAVAGFDDIVLARHLNPPLTTVHVDAFGLGRARGRAAADPPARARDPRPPSRTDPHHAGDPRLVRRATRSTNEPSRRDARGAADPSGRTPRDAAASRSSVGRVSPRRRCWPPVCALPRAGRPSASRAAARPRRRTPRGTAVAADTHGVPRHARATHVRLLLGAQRPDHRADAGPLADAVRSSASARSASRSPRTRSASSAAG